MATLTLNLSQKVTVADSLPSTNFGFDDLRDRMNRFTLRFDAFIERERKRILDERNRFRMDLTEVQGMFLLFMLYGAQLT
jgi:kinetochore protein Spc25, fungi type